MLLMSITSRPEHPATKSNIFSTFSSLPKPLRSRVGVTVTPAEGVVFGSIKDLLNI